LQIHGLIVQLNYIGLDLDGSSIQNWVPNALSLVQAVGGPVIVSEVTPLIRWPRGVDVSMNTKAHGLQSFASDTFQARKTLLIGTCTVSFIGAAIAPGSSNIYRVIVAQILIGFGFAAVPLAYAIPSEVCFNMVMHTSPR
jgi:hypothetical protein